MPFEVPESWEWCQVSDIFELNPKNDVPDDTQSGFIPMVCVDDGFGYAHSFETRPWGEIRKGYSHFKNGDISIAKISPCFENRKSTIFYDLPNGIGAGTTELTVLRGYCVNTEFFLYLFQSEWYLFEGTKEFKGVVGQQRVNKEIFTTLLIPLPPIEEQNRIVTEIRKLFSVIEVLDDDKEDLNESVQKAKSKILDLAVHGKLVTQDPNDEPAIELLKRINPKFAPCDNAHCPYDIPENWYWCKLIDLCSFLSRGKSPTYSEERKYPVFAQKCNLYGGGISLNQARFLDPNTISKWPEEYKLRDGDILVNSTGTGTVGRTRLFHSDCLGNYPFVVPDSHISVVRTVENIDSDYIYSIISSRYGQEYLEDNLAGSTNQKELYIGVLENMLIPLPPHEEQRRIANKIEELFAVLDEIQKSIEA